MTPPLSSAAKFSLTALGLPGNVTTRVLLIIPAMGRERAARGVCLSDSAMMRWTRPGAGRSSSGEMAYEKDTLNGCIDISKPSYLWSEISGKYSKPLELLSAQRDGNVPNPKTSSPRGNNPVVCPTQSPSFYCTLDACNIIRYNSRCLYVKMISRVVD
jgi:hypothetical protein